jgi:uncharacterized protein CbrC (UPF0167 family)
LKKADLAMRYFAASDSQIQWYAERLSPYDADFAPTPVVCDCCGRIGPCIRYSPDFILEKLGCLNCLRMGTFFYYHDTEVGRMVPGYQFQRHVGNPFQGTTQVVYDRFPPDFSEAAFDELLRTPPYRFLQHEQWLLHCNDFMIALGRWTPDDLHAHAGDEDPESLLNAMLDADRHGPRTLEELHLGLWLNVFQCLHCGKLRAHQEW